MAGAAGIAGRSNQRQYAPRFGRIVGAFTLLGLVVSCAGCKHSPNLTRGPQSLELGRCGFATIYAALTGTVYFVLLTFVAPRLARGEIEGMEVFLFVPFDSFLYSVDILGYSFMSVSTLLAGRVFRGRGLRRIVRWLLTANGMLLPFIALQIYYHPLIWCASLWAVTFPGATWALAILFRRETTAFSSSTVPES